MNVPLIDDRTLPHLLAVLVLTSRIGDALSTYLLSPTLLLEMNVIVSRGGWSIALLSLLVSLVPYYSTGLGVVVLTTSFLATGSNLSRCWVARALGEAEYRAIFLRAASRAKRSSALILVLASAACPAFVGSLLMWFSGSEAEWGYWFGLGIALYGVAIALHGSNFVFQLFHEASVEKPAVWPTVG
jgi:hypothetical protein